jgi:hypothetical protein
MIVDMIEGGPGKLSHLCRGDVVWVNVGFANDIIQGVIRGVVDVLFRLHFYGCWLLAFVVGSRLELWYRLELWFMWLVGRLELWFMWLVGRLELWFMWLVAIGRLSFLSFVHYKCSGRQAVVSVVYKCGWEWKNKFVPSTGCPFASFEFSLKSHPRPVKSSISVGD